jgi:leader peptidase (prepilin peptidase) / N-methyltransferase
MMIGIVVPALVGLAGGAVLPLPVYRLSVPWREPEAGEPASPTRDGCTVCRQELAPGVPGWLSFGTRCRRCAARLGPPTWLLALLGGLGAAGLGWRIGPHPVLVPYLFGLLLGLLLGIVDGLSQRLPDVLVYPGIAVSVALFAAVALLDRNGGAFLRALAAAGALFGVYLLMAVLPGAAIGGGDLGLAALLGLYLGWLGWPVVVLGAALPWLLQAAVALLVLARGRAGAKTMIAFGPSMLVGAYLVLVVLPGIVALLSG